MNHNFIVEKIFFILLIFILLIRCAKKEEDYSKWLTYGGTKDAARYSSLNQITKENVSQLEVAWEYKCDDGTTKSQMQCQPIVVDSFLYATTPALDLIALHAGTGKEIWRFNPKDVLVGKNSLAGVNRGVTYFENKEIHRILFCADKFLLSVDALTGKPVCRSQRPARARPRSGGVHSLPPHRTGCG